MGKTCLICDNTFSKGSDVSFHTFPRNHHSRKRWCDAIGLNISEVTGSDVVCSDHFSPGEIRLGPSGKKKFLVETAVPGKARLSRTTASVSDVSGQSCDKQNIPLKPSGEVVQKQLESEITPLSEQNRADPSKSDKPEPNQISLCSEKSSSTLTASEVEIEKRPVIKRSRKHLPRYPGDCSSDDVKSRTRAQRRGRILKQTIVRQKEILQKLEREKQILKERNASIKSLMKYLKKHYSPGKSAEAVIRELSDTF